MTTYIPHDGWHKGPPPHIGWWVASLRRSKSVWRWWNGEQWSVAVYPGCPYKSVNFLASWASSTISEIEWSHYYPKNARVARQVPDFFMAGPGKVGKP